MTRPRHLLVVDLAERFRRETGHDISRNGAALHKLLEAVEEAVRALQDAEAVDVEVPAIAVHRGKGMDLRLPLTREDALRAAEVRAVEQLLD